MWEGVYHFKTSAYVAKGSGIDFLLDSSQVLMYTIYRLDG